MASHMIYFEIIMDIFSYRHTKILSSNFTCLSTTLPDVILNTITSKDEYNSQLHHITSTCCLRKESKCQHERH